VCHLYAPETIYGFPQRRFYSIVLTEHSSLGFSAEIVKCFATHLKHMKRPAAKPLNRTLTLIDINKGED
jgi:hypothetical protein